LTRGRRASGRPAGDARGATRIDGLDGLRALAALAVFGVHFNQTVRLEGRLGPFDLARLLANGEHGVSLFFTLSGFLLGMPFWRALDAGGARPALGSYAVRRLARILPAYYVALTALIVLSGMWRYAQTYPDIALHYAFLFNLTEFSIFSINPPFWTLAVEVQFYALLPLAFAALARASAAWRPWLLVALAVAAYALHHWLMSSVTRIVDWPLDPRMPWIRPYGAVLSHSLLAHLPHFLLGVVAGLPFMRAREKAAGPWRRPWVSEAAFWSALALAGVLVGTALEDAVAIPYGRYGLPLVPLLLATLVVTAPATRLARRCLEGFPLRRLGTISYGFYIYHVPCLALVDRAMAARGLDAAEHGLAFGAAGFALSVAVATASYLLVERPALGAARRLGRGTR
jgi:peptidoglycan/LPS O-acetylase OafA/YrhL